MALVNTINFLPQVFRTATNQRFLGATLDQLTSDAVNAPVNGYIGRTFAPTYKLGDNYVPEANAARTNYQLEASVVVKNADNNIAFNSGYIDLLKSINSKGGFTNNQQRLFSAESYSYDGHFDYDKFVNYNDYYWMPDGPDVVNVYANQVPYTGNFNITRNNEVGGYTFNGYSNHPNSQITLSRGGNYTFTVDQPGYKFWIQTQPGVTGLDSNISTVSTREVFGVDNNGIDNGVIRFNPPLATAQDFYIKMPQVAIVDIASTIDYTKIQDRLLSEFLREFPGGIDGVNTLLQNKTFIFVNNDVDDAFWTVNGETVSETDRINVWQISLLYTGTDYRILIRPTAAVNVREKVFVKSGKTYASTQFWLDNNNRYNRVPIITAPANYLYYQDEANPEFTGEIKLVDNVASTIDVTNDILGKVGYTSPNGVIFTNGLKIRLDSSVIPSSYANKEYFVEGVGTSIKLVDAAQLVVPEEFGTILDTTADYITINRGSRDRNAWSRSNRWVHKQVLADAAKYNSSFINYGPNIFGRRPIVEFDSDLQLFNHGQAAKRNIDLFTLEYTDAFNQVEGQINATIDGVAVAAGQRIIFGNDYDNNVKNKIWLVHIEYINNTRYINLVETDDDPVLYGETVVALSGATNKARTFRYTTNAAGQPTWLECQAKTNVNQPPLFDLVDGNGYSFGDTTVYPSTTFAGTAFFGYAVGTGTNDTILGFPLKYQNFNNIGDIVFQNHYESDSFTCIDNYATETINLNTGFLVKNSGLSSNTKLNSWVKNVEDTTQYQLFTKFYDGYVITETDGTERAFVQIDVLPLESKLIPHLKVYLNNVLLTAGIDYVLTTYGIYNIVKLLALPAIGDKINVAVFSKSVSSIGHYDIPQNLDLNPLNETFTSVTLGQIRNHYTRSIENTNLSGRPLRDTYVKSQGGTLVQHSAPLIYSISFLNDPSINFTDSINLARKEYTRFKNKFLSLCSTIKTLDYKDPVNGVDTILQNINAVKNSSFPWYYSDMVPTGDHTSITYNVLNSRQTQYEISGIFNNSELSNRAVLIYLNGVQLVVDNDYTFSKTIPAVLITTPLTVGDVITIKDYSDTDGNYIPETPSKLGLYPKFAPEIYTDITYQTPTSVIKGHDGSITPAFGDFRDNYLLELERRIYNNIKADYSKNQIDLFSIVPGRFRTTDYTKEEVDEILTENFLQWVGVNKVDYITNKWADANDAWTWNYGTFSDKITGKALQGSWRAIYNYWFDTDTPNLTPWQMLGFSVKPSWWDTRYGVSPYTSGNTLLWQDLEAGYVWNNGDHYIDSKFARPGLTGFIPVDSAGNLLNPTQIPLTLTNSTSGYSNNFAIGEQGPTETAWRRSSDYPYAVQVMLALANPGMYFGTQIDTSRFYLNSVTGQISNATNQRISPKLLAVNGDSTSGTVKRTSGYLNWVADRIKNLGVDPVTNLNNYFKNLSVQLNYKIGGFTSKKLITVSAEQTTPGSINASVIIPESNYQVYLSKSVPVDTLVYSAVIVEKTEGGYSVSGYDTNNSIFTIIPSVSSNNNEVVTINETSAKVYQDHTGKTMMVPYGTTYSTIQQVVDFLISYERYLISKGFTFTQFSTDLQEQMDWRLSIKEFLYWSQQGWGSGTIIVLNPASTKLVIQSQQSVVDEITNLTDGSRLLNQSFAPIKSNAFNILRYDNIANGNTCTVSSLDGSTICYGRFNLIQHEHVLVFDNVSDFGDIIYVPSQGSRQYRLKLAGVKTGAWTGALSAPGYIYSDSTISNWVPGTDYKIGDIVKFNELYYTAKTNISATETFNKLNWTQITQNDIRTGLLPSFGQNAQQFANIYDIDNPPADGQLQEFSAGLIGFRPRGYLTDLGVSITNQTKIYQGFIKQKGTHNAISALTKATFDNVSGEISTYEEWALQVGKYGDLDRNQYSEFVLDQNVFTSNPVAFTVTTDTYSTGNIIVNLKLDANLLVSNIYNSSNLSSLSTSLYNNRTVTRYPTDLPDVGYVHVGDVDATEFDIEKYNQVTNIGSGYKIWVAKDVNKTWNVYRVTETGLHATKVSYSLDSYAKLTFNKRHTFVADDYITVSGFDPYIDGVYKVINTPTASTVTIQITDTTNLNRLITVGSITSNGLVHILVSAHVDTLAAIDTLRPAHGWIDNDRIWVDNVNDNGWGVYTFNRPWLANSVASLTADTITANARFGNSVKINSNYYYVGNPGNKQVQVFVGTNGSYAANVTLANSFANFGSVVESQGNIIAVGSQNLVHVFKHDNGAITPVANIAFNGVSSISMSKDGKNIFVGGNNTVGLYKTTNYMTYTISGSPIANTGSFGTTVKTNDTATKLFVSAPDTTDVYANCGIVNYYPVVGGNVDIANVKVLHSSFKNTAGHFGASLDIDSTATNLFIGSPGSNQSGLFNGLVERYVFSSNTYVHQSNIAHPDEEVGAFGSSLSISNDGQVLAVGSPGSSMTEHTTFDQNSTVIDSQTTNFVDLILNSGAIYVFEPIEAPGIDYYTYTQELEVAVHDGDQFGASVVATNGAILVGAPGTGNNAGEAYIFSNSNNSRAWNLTRNQGPLVDIDSINRTFIYNKVNNNILSALDYIDPAKGKILNIVAKDIDFQRVDDPAIYNAGTGTVHPDYHWGPQQTGKIWWDLSTVRYVNYEQDDLIYRLNHWGQLFSGSSIDVYEWVESAVLPSEYTGAGTPLHANDSAYSTYGYVDQGGTVRLKYYFWVKNKNTIGNGKSNSIIGIANAIENPQTQGVPYATVLREDTLALHNVNSYLTGKNSVVHIGSKTPDAALMHSEYALVQEKNPASKIPNSILNKLIDSLAGVDAVGNQVPDPALTPAQRYGINIRPRQSIFIDRQLALKNYLAIINEKLLAYPVVQRKILTTLNSGAPVPNANSGSYNTIVNTIEELGYIDTAIISTDYKVLVNRDSSNLGKWAIYTWSGSAWATSTVQEYKTNLYWTYADWHDSSFNPTTTIDLTVENQLELGKKTLTANTYVKVKFGGNNKFTIYRINSDLSKTIVGIESGTIQISTGTIPEKELRQILISLQSEIFIEDLAQEYNQVFFSMLKYALTEQKNIDWAFKTSFFTATQYLRKLEQFPSYIADNQNYYRDYINEVKPYRTILREFVVDYKRNDQFSGDITDFDLPPYWDKHLNVYRGPSGEQSYDSTTVTTGVYSQWNNNYKYQVVEVQVDNPGTGYYLAPQIVITGGGGTGATAYATINANNQISTIYIVSPGSGYTTTPTVTIRGTGTGAVAHAVLRNVYDGSNSGHNVVRSISTKIKFDRTTYINPTTFVSWANITSANVGQTLTSNTVLVIGNDFYRLANNYVIDEGLTFPSANVVTVTVNEFDNANDRIVAFNGNVDFRLIDDGIDYPGLIVEGNTYVGTDVDTIIQSRYTDASGIDINSYFDIDGGKYVDQFESHAPQELVPGRMYDNLNLQVFQGTKDSSELAFRLTESMNHVRGAYRISNSNTTKLIANLALTDKNIFVQDATRLPNPNRILGIPGIVYINGEKIIYYRNYATEVQTPWTANTVIVQDTVASFDGNYYLTTGNVYAPNVMWVANTQFKSNSYFYYSGNTYQATSDIKAPYFANIIANTRLIHNTEESGFFTIQSNVAIIGGNVNILTQLRRAVDATAPFDIHTVNSRVSDASIIQSIPRATIDNLRLTSDTTFLTTSYVTLGVVLTAPISANIGDELSQVLRVDSWKPNTILSAGALTSYSGNSYTVTGNVNSTTFESIKGNVSFAFAGNVKTTVSLRLLETIHNSTQFGAIVVSGTLEGLPEVFDGNLGFDVEGFDNTTSTILINGVDTTTINGAGGGAYVNSSYKLGQVTLGGKYTVPAGTVLKRGQSWYNRGPGSASNGNGLYSSTTEQAQFLKAQPGYTP